MMEIEIQGCSVVSLCQNTSCYINWHFIKGDDLNGVHDRTCFQSSLWRGFGLLQAGWITQTSSHLYRRLVLWKLPDSLSVSGCDMRGGNNPSSRSTRSDCELQPFTHWYKANKAQISQRCNVEFASAWNDRRDKYAMILARWQFEDIDTDSNSILASLCCPALVCLCRAKATQTCRRATANCMEREFLALYTLTNGWSLGSRPHLLSEGHIKPMFSRT